MKTGWVKAKVREASDRNYLDAVLPLLNSARKEIVLSLYLLEPNDEAGANHPVNQLMESLLRATKRGARVHIVLNANFRFRPKSEVASGNYFQRLLASGAEVISLLPNRRLHDKLIVIDARYVVEGSTNWSAAALTSNYESASVIDSRVYAKEKLKRIELLTAPPFPKERTIDRPLLPIPETVDFPSALLEEKILARMIQTSDERALDLYLLLWGQAAASRKREFEIDLETVGGELGLSRNWDRSTLRRQIIKVLKKLKNRYAFIEIEFPYARNAVVRLKEIPGQRIPIPGWIFSGNYLAQATGPAAFLALAREALKQEGVEIDSLSAPELQRRFGIGYATVLRTRATA